jgi:hypothetical protein
MQHRGCNRRVWSGKRRSYAAGPTSASALQRPAARPAIGRTVEADLGIKDLCALRNADLANDQASFVRNDSHVPVVTTTERADDIAEVRRILHGGEGIA